MRHEDRHLGRLERDASALGLGAFDADAARRALRDAGRTFGAGAGIVRLELSRESGRLRFAVTTRPLGEPSARWKAITSAEPHPGPDSFAGAKRSGVSFLECARRAANEAGADEALAFDVAGRLVEGARSNLIVVSNGGDLCTPPLARGAVSGVALSILRGAAPDLCELDLTLADLARARELIAINAVRGAVSIVAFDGRSIGEGRPGPCAARLARLLDAAA